MASRTLTLKSPQEMQAWGRSFAKQLKKGDVVALIGPLGAGKTTLVQGIAAGWGSKTPALSPTFALANEYRSKRGFVFHMDLYRLSPKELTVFPLEDYLDQGVCLIEWADRIRDRWPDKVISIKLKIIGETKRQLTLKK